MNITTQREAGMKLQEVSSAANRLIDNIEIVIRGKRGAVEEIGEITGFLKTPSMAGENRRRTGSVKWRKRSHRLSNG